MISRRCFLWGVAVRKGCHCAVRDEGFCAYNMFGECTVVYVHWEMFIILLVHVVLFYRIYLE